jgi:hypothetical protein
MQQGFCLLPGLVDIFSSEREQDKII